MVRCSKRYYDCSDDRLSLLLSLSLSLFLRFNLNAARKSVMDIMERGLGKKKKRFLEQKRLL